MASRPAFFWSVVRRAKRARGGAGALAEGEHFGGEIHESN